MSLTLFLPKNTTYLRPLADYLFEYFKFKTWSGDYEGFHLTIVHFLPLFIISVFLVRKYSIKELNLNFTKVFLINVILIVAFSFITDHSVLYIKRQSKNLQSIAITSEENFLTYKYDDKDLIEFSARFELTNYSDMKKSFYINLSKEYFTLNGRHPIKILDKDGNNASFSINGNETKVFYINLDDYQISDSHVVGGSGRGYIDELIVWDESGKVVKLNSNNFLGVNLSK